MIMQIPEERKNEPFLGVSGPAVCSFVSRGENVILRPRKVKASTAQTGKMEARQEATVWKTKRCEKLCNLVFFKDVKYSVSTLPKVFMLRLVL